MRTIVANSEGVFEIINGRRRKYVDYWDGDSIKCERRAQKRVTKFNKRDNLLDDYEEKKQPSYKRNH